MACSTIQQIACPIEDLSMYHNTNHDHDKVMYRRLLWCSIHHHNARLRRPPSKALKYALEHTVKLKISPPCHCAGTWALRAQRWWQHHASACRHPPKPSAAWPLGCALMCAPHPPPPAPHTPAAPPPHPAQCAQPPQHRQTAGRRMRARRCRGRARTKTLRLLMRPAWNLSAGHLPRCALTAPHRSLCSRPCKRLQHVMRTVCGTSLHAGDMHA